LGQALTTAGLTELLLRAELFESDCPVVIGVRWKCVF